MKHARFLCTAAAAVILAGALTAFPVSAEAPAAEGFAFSENADGSLTVSVTDSAQKEVDVPADFAGALSLRVADDPPAAWEVLRIPAGITEIALDDAYMPKLRQFEVAGENPNYQSIDGVLFDKSGKTLLCYPAARENTVYTVPAGTEAIADYAFRGAQCIEEINLPVGLKSIGMYAFLACRFPTAALPVSAESVGAYAFGWNEALKTVTVPENTRVYGSCFTGCAALAEVTFLRSDPLSYGWSIPGEHDDFYDGVFNDFAGSAAVYAPDGSLPEYREKFSEAIGAGTVTLHPISEKPQAELSGIAGDANNDGALSPADVFALTDWLCGGSPALAPAQADLDGSGAINAIDLSLMKRQILAE